MAGNGGIIGVKNTGQSGVWAAEDVFLDRNGIRIPLLHRWPLTENANDAVGALHLTNNGSVTFSAGGASFNGSSQWLSGVLEYRQPFTLTAWIKPSAWTNAPIAAANANGSKQWGLSTYGGKLYGVFGGLNIQGQTFDGAHFPDNVNTFVCIASDGAIAHKLFCGATKYESTDAFTAEGSDDFSIGRDGALANYYFAGLVLDVRFYSHCLSDADIAALYAAGPNP